MEEKQKIVERVHSLFHKYGAKSVTMDDVSSHCGISKKTLYEHFPTKEYLLEHIVDFTQKEINKSISALQSLEYNPIVEVLESHKRITNFLKNDNDVFFRQLQKYYPKIYHICKNSINSIIENYFASNLRRGIELSFYKKNIDIDFLTELLFVSVIGIKSSEKCDELGISHTEAVQRVLHFFLQSIMSDKGFKFYNTLEEKNEK